MDVTVKIKKTGKNEFYLLITKLQKVGALMIVYNHSMGNGHNIQQKLEHWSSEYSFHVKWTHRPPQSLGAMMIV